MNSPFYIKDKLEKAKEKREMKIFVTNAGSSSFKFQVFEMPEETVLCSGNIERIGDPQCFCDLKVNGEKKHYEKVLDNHTEAVHWAVKLLIENNIIKSAKEISAVGHRTVHGLNNTKSQKVNEAFMKDEEVFCEVAPLHMPACFAGIYACKAVFGDVNYVVFDTAFHQTMPEKAYSYAIKREEAEEYKIRKYGFHGMSHQYVSEIAAKEYAAKKIISCHMGNGCSITAIENGKSLDTSMGLTPLEGVVMGTRGGNIDPGAVLYLAEKRGYSYRGMVAHLNKNYGVKGVFGSNDMRDVENELANNPRAKLAFDMFCYSITKFIGSYAAVLNGVDCIIFTAGIGERGSLFRKAICKNLTYLGAYLDEDLNEKLNRKAGVISTPDSKVKIVIIPTNEELVIAKETYDLIKAGK